jgi:hypothetical protein
MCDYARSASPGPYPLVEPDSANAAYPVQERASDSPGRLYVELSVNSAYSFEATRAPAGLHPGKDFAHDSYRLLHLAVLKSLGEIADPKFAHRGALSL